jgi:polysaccharide export outer membrane protein
MLACGTSQVYRGYHLEPDPRKSSYILGPGDQVHINVWDNSNLTTTAIIRPDGTLTMPLVGDIEAAGQTPKRVKGIIENRLRSYLKGQTISITVAVTQVRNYRFIVAGQVGNPGVFSVEHYVTVKEAVAMAGGPTRYADAEHAYIVRKNGKGKVRKIPINYAEIVTGEQPHQDIVIIPGDVIYVP